MADTVSPPSLERNMEMVKRVWKSRTCLDNNNSRIVREPHATRLKVDEAIGSERLLLNNLLQVFRETTKANYDCNIFTRINAFYFYCCVIYNFLVKYVYAYSSYSF